VYVQAAACANESHEDDVLAEQLECVRILYKGPIEDPEQEVAEAKKRVDYLVKDKKLASAVSEETVFSSSKDKDVATKAAAEENAFVRLWASAKSRVLTTFNNAEIALNDARVAQAVAIVLIISLILISVLIWVLLKVLNLDEGKIGNAEEQHFFAS